MVRLRNQERTLSIGEAALFFDQNTQWLRWRERQGLLTRDDGSTIDIGRTVNEKMGGGDRRYTLENIRDIAHALRRAEILDNEQLKTILQRVDAFEHQV